MEEIAERGVKPGDLVGDLPDPNVIHNNELSALNVGGAAGGTKGERGGTGGVYRAGGPTTIFGGTGWGPYSDGPLNAVRKSILSRDGVTEENWAYMMATRVQDANDEWSKLRKENLRPIGGNAENSLAIPEGLMVSGTTMGGAPLPVTEKVLNAAKGLFEEPPLGVYEPHTNSILCEYNINSFDHH